MNIQSIRDTLKIFNEDEVVEVRVLDGNKVISGYFKDNENLIREIMPYKNKTIYMTFNAINEACYSRSQCEKMIPYAKQTTKDTDVETYKWLFLDADPKRTTGVSATDKEKEEARDVMRKVYVFLRDMGFSYPIVADSGNGYHLMYRIQVSATFVDGSPDTENIKMLEDFMKTISMLFSTETVEIDKAVFNPSRITKLYGSMATKGASTEERPHRNSGLLVVPDEIKMTSKKLIQKVVDMLPKEPEPIKREYGKNYQGNEVFDLEGFLVKNGIRAKKSNGNGYTKYLLEHCVFDESHTAPDSAIFRFDNGAISYKCFHNSCSNKTWRDVRLKYEPDAYNSVYKGKVKHEYAQPPKNYNSTTDYLKSNSIPPNFDDDSDFMQMSDIIPEDKDGIVYIKSGITEIDKCLNGFRKGELSVWSGSNGSGKSTLLSQIAIQAVQNKFKVAIFSGELTPQRVQNWLHLQCAGRQFVKIWENSNKPYVPYDIQARINEWLNDSIYLYRNTKGFNVEKVFEKFKTVIKEQNIDMIILDNLMAFDIGSSYDKYDNQSLTVKFLSQMAKDFNIHIHFVCHPRKVLTFLRKNDIAGTADITNMADNVFIVHRVNRNFKLGIGQFDMMLKDKLCGTTDENGNPTEEPFSNVVEVCKNRENGIEDKFVGTFFEVESKRFLNDKYDNPVFGWQDNMRLDEIFTEMQDLPSFDLSGFEDVM